MEKILFVNACVRPESRTLILAKCLLACLGNDYTEVNVTDGNIKPLDFKALNERAEKIRRADFSDASFAPARQFAEADTVVIAAPFWDLSFPSCMKIYLENILVSGLTFTYRSGRPEGLCRTKRLLSSLFYINYFTCRNCKQKLTTVFLRTGEIFTTPGGYTKGVVE